MRILHGQPLIAVAVAILFAAVACKGNPVSGEISSLHLHQVAGAPDSAIEWEVFYFAGFPCVNSHPDREDIRAENCRGITLTATSEHDMVEPVIMWNRPTVGRSLLFDWGPPNDRIAAVHWDPDTEIVWLAVALTTDRCSFVEVNQLFLERSPDTDQLLVAKVAQSSHTIDHEPDHLGRASSISMTPALESGVLVTVHHGRELTTDIDIAIASKRHDPRVFRSPMLDRVEGLQDAIQRHVRDRAEEQ